MAVDERRMISVQYRALRRSQPSALTARVLIWDKPEDWRAIATAGVATINVNAERETAESLQALQGTGRPVLAYTVNDLERAKFLFDQGVAGLFTDTPQTLLPAAASYPAARVTWRNQ
jgi:Glycerophosphoryl diester phosphodiesterase